VDVIDARFGHVNLIARDWRALAAFYQRVLGCTPVPPERDLRGEALSAATGVPNAALRGIHLRLPGGGPAGPTLEIFEYDPSLTHPPTAANRPGFGHIAFVVPDVDAARATVVDEGGTPVGEVIATPTTDGRRVTWCYVADPEGNIVELQAWSVA
jgi:catechol 2,3-dioxygenase-like lactoylglutathione lyase family enzyme